MTTTGNDTLGTRSTLSVGGKNYAYYSLDKAAAKLGDVSRLPFSMKVLLENLLRFEDGGFTVSTDDVQALVDWQKDPHSNREIQYRPARVLLQDFTGVPCVVDLAAMRDAIAKLGGDTTPVSQYAFTHYVSLYAAKAAFEKSGAIDSEALVNGLEGISVDGPTGKVTVGKDHHVTLEMYTAKTEGAGLTVVEDLGQIAPQPGCT